jgi:hypothetical protein
LEKPKAIVVDRDPRDIYLLSKYVLRYESKRCVPTDTTEQFITFFKSQRKQKNNADNVLHLNFEDIVYEYESTKEKIMRFLDLKEHSAPLKFFNPEISINNTQLFNIFKDDLSLINKELKDYFYPFENYKPVNNSPRGIF